MNDPVTDLTLWSMAALAISFAFVGGFVWLAHNFKQQG